MRQKIPGASQPGRPTGLETHELEGMSARQSQLDLSSHSLPGGGTGPYPSPSLTLHLDVPTEDLVLPSDTWVRRKSSNQ